MPKKKTPLTEEEIQETQEYLDTRFLNHNALQKKIGNIRKDMITYLGPVLINEINREKVILRKNQLGVGVSDEGIEIRIHVNKSSRIDYTISTIDWDGNIKVFPDKDHMEVIDRILPLLKQIMPKY